jgi:polyisoprenoid-binding protein YceI
VVRFCAPSAWTGEDRYEIIGELTIKGHSDTVRVPFTWRMAGGIARMHGEARVDRSHFGIGEGEWSDGSVIGLDVQVIVDLALDPAGESS